MLAWAAQPARDGDRWTVRELHDFCEQCPRGKSHDLQEIQRCTFVPIRRWADPGSNLGFVGGLPADHDSGDEHPIEPNEEGCPGGWYRCAFVWSLQRYIRPCADGVYSPNLHLERTSDRLIIDAVHYYEQEHARWRGWVEERMRS